MPSNVFVRSVRFATLLIIYYAILYENGIFAFPRVDEQRDPKSFNYKDPVIPPFGYFPGKDNKEKKDPTRFLEPEFYTNPSTNLKPEDNISPSTNTQPEDYIHSSTLGPGGYTIHTSTFEPTDSIRPSSALVPQNYIHPKIIKPLDYSHPSELESKDYINPLEMPELEDNIHLSNISENLKFARLNDSKKKFNHTLEARGFGPFNESSTEDEDIVITTDEPTPMVFLARLTGIRHNELCNGYGYEVYRSQMSSLSVKGGNGNPKAKDFQSKICRLAWRLECVPLRAQPFNNASGPGPGTGIKQRPDYSNSSKRNGVCRCMRGLSDRAIFLPANKILGPPLSGCYIPAGFAHSSLCGHEVALPYGFINNGTLIRRIVGDTRSLCVPNSECRIGYTYTGFRCSCIKTAIWQRKNGTCVLPLDGYRLIPILFLEQILIGMIVVYISI